MNKPTEEQLKALLYEITGKEASIIQDSSQFKEDLAMDSISVADLLASLEEDYEIIIEQEQAVQLQSFGQLKNFINNLS